MAILIPVTLAYDGYSKVTPNKVKTIATRNILEVVDISKDPDGNAATLAQITYKDGLNKRLLFVTETATAIRTAANVSPTT